MKALRKDETIVDRIVAAIELGDEIEDLLDELADAIERAGKAGVNAAMVQVELDDEGILDVANEHAIAYAEERAAEMVGKKWVDNELVDNPNAAWRIDESTREMIRDVVEQGMQEGWSNDKLANAINEHYTFSDERAEVIARTETAFADVNGNLAVYRESGITKKKWMTAPDCCDECQELNDVVVDIDDDFPNDGGDGPPLHPNCRCDVLPVLTDDD